MECLLVERAQRLQDDLCFPSPGPRSRQPGACQRGPRASLSSPRGQRPSRCPRFSNASADRVVEPP
eukprot:11204525-Lingulodinium_polyedra.AAC.1